MNRDIPSAVKRTLRQESGFGCALCGCPIIDYHHIIEWKEKRHHDPEHMIAVCPTHHRELAKSLRKKAYLAKQNPFNIRKGFLRGQLTSNKEQIAVLAGSNRYINVGSILTFAGVDLLSFSVNGDLQILFNCILLSHKYDLEVKIRENEFYAFLEDFWDIEFGGQWINFRRKSRDSALLIDFRSGDAEISGRIPIGPEVFEFPKSETTFAGRSVSGCTFMNSHHVFAFGAGRRLLLPNRAMARPRGVLR